MPSSLSDKALKRLYYLCLFQEYECTAIEIIIIYAGVYDEKICV